MKQWLEDLVKTEREKLAVLRGEESNQENKEVDFASRLRIAQYEKLLIDLCALCEENAQIDAYAISDFLASTWDRFKGSYFSYTSIPDAPTTKLCLALAKQLHEKDPSKGVYQYLMPTLTHVEDISESYWHDVNDYPLGELCLADDHQSLIPVYSPLAFINPYAIETTPECLFIPGHITNLYVGTDKKAFSEGEKQRLWNHSELTRRIFNLMEDIYLHKQDKDSVGSYVENLIAGFRRAGEEGLGTYIDASAPALIALIAFNDYWELIKNSVYPDVENAFKEIQGVLDKLNRTPESNTVMCVMTSADMLEDILNKYPNLYRNPDSSTLKEELKNKLTKELENELTKLREHERPGGKKENGHDLLGMPDHVFLSYQRVRGPNMREADSAIMQCLLEHRALIRESMQSVDDFIFLFERPYLDYSEKEIIFTEFEHKLTETLRSEDDIYRLLSLNFFLEKKREIYIILTGIKERYKSWDASSLGQGDTTKITLSPLLKQLLTIPSPLLRHSKAFSEIAFGRLTDLLTEKNSSKLSKNQIQLIQEAAESFEKVLKPQFDSLPEYGSDCSFSAFTNRITVIMQVRERLEDLYKENQKILVGTYKNKANFSHDHLEERLVEEINWMGGWIKAQDEVALEKVNTTKELLLFLKQKAEQKDWRPDRISAIWQGIKKSLGYHRKWLPEGMKRIQAIIGRAEALEKKNGFYDWTSAKDLIDDILATRIKQTTVCLGLFWKRTPQTAKSYEACRTQLAASPTK